MSNPATLGSMTDRVRSITDNVGSKFVSDPEIHTWLNVGLSKLHDILIVHFEDYYEKRFTFSTIAGQSDYALPPDFYKLQGVDVLVGLIQYSVPRFMNRERNRRQFTSLPFFSDMSYRVISNFIRFIPTPSLAVPITVVYAPSFQTLVSDNDLIDQVVPPGWEEYAVLDAAVQCRVKDELPPQDIQPLLQMQATVMAGIERLADDRDSNESAHVVDVTRRASLMSGYSYADDGFGEW